MTTEATNTGRRGRKRAHGEGTIKQRSDGRWEGQVSLPDGTRRSVYSKTRRGLTERMTEIQRSVQQGLPVPAGRQTLGQFLDRWLADVVRPGVRPSTYRSYAGYVKNQITPALGRLPLDQVTPQHIQRFMNEKHAAGLSPRTVQYLRAILRRALGQALKWNLVARNAATLVDPPRLKRKKPPVLNAAQAQALMDAMAGDRLEALVTILIVTGLRRGEVLGLHWSDVDLETGTLSVGGQYQRVDGSWEWVEPKTESSVRTLALPTMAVSMLRTHRTQQLELRLAAGPSWTDHDLVFPAALGTPQDGDSLSHQFAKRVRRANETARSQGLDPLPPVTLHGLRHSAATMLLAQGVTLAEVQKILGHSQIALTADLYTQFVPEIARRAADTMDALFRRAD